MFQHTDIFNYTELLPVSLRHRISEPFGIIELKSEDGKTNNIYNYKIFVFASI